jgi:hypothetical protein
VQIRRLDQAADQSEIRLELSISEIRLELSISEIRLELSSSEIRLAEQFRD